MSCNLITYELMLLKIFVLNYQIVGMFLFFMEQSNRFFLGKNRVMQVALGRSEEEEYRDDFGKK